MTETLPGYDSPLAEESVHSMFHVWEKYRDQGITKVIFKNFFDDAKEEKSLTGSGLHVDFLDKKNIFAYLLSEEREVHRGMVFDRVDPYTERPEASIVPRAKMGKMMTVVPGENTPGESVQGNIQITSNATSFRRPVDPVDMVDHDLMNPVSSGIEEKHGDGEIGVQEPGVVGKLSPMDVDGEGKESTADTAIDWSNPFGWW